MQCRQNKAAKISPVTDQNAQLKYHRSSYHLCSSPVCLIFHCGRRQRWAWRHQPAGIPIPTWTSIQCLQHSRRPDQINTGMRTKDTGETITAGQAELGKTCCSICLPLGRWRKIKRAILSACNCGGNKSFRQHTSWAAWFTQVSSLHLIYCNLYLGTYMGKVPTKKICNALFVYHQP